jgi:hypothetical protein
MMLIVAQLTIVCDVRAPMIKMKLNWNWYVDRQAAHPAASKSRRQFKDKT